MTRRLNEIRRERDGLLHQLESITAKLKVILLEEEEVLGSHEAKKAGRKEQEGRKEEEGGNSTIGPNVRVRCIRRDAYFGRTGIIIGPHGPKKLYWDIKLDQLVGESKSPTIHKMASSLEIIR
jgi:hypothetical protein